MQENIDPNFELAGICENCGKMCDVVYDNGNCQLCNDNDNDFDNRMWINEITYALDLGFAKNLPTYNFHSRDHLYGMISDSNGLGFIQLNFKSVLEIGFKEYLEKLIKDNDKVISALKSENEIANKTIEIWKKTTGYK